MSDWLPSYDYEGDRITASFEGKVIASGTDFEKVACTAEEYLSGLRSERKASRQAEKRANATHIKTPNGLTGEILSRVTGVWGEEEITVRFENGRIARLETAGDVEYEVQSPKEASSPTEALESRLAAEYASTRKGLTARLVELDDIRRTARTVMSAESFGEQSKIHHLVLAAEAEELEIKQALSHLDAVDAENAAPEAPRWVAAEQVSLGRGDDWLEVTAREMVAESEDQDFDQILAEDPATLVAEMHEAALADAGIVRGAALSHVMARTAGFQGEAVEAYREQFLAATEVARRAELKSRTQTARTAAAVVEASIEDVSDEALFL
jgi:hypothetical protein